MENRLEEVESQGGWKLKKKGEKKENEAEIKEQNETKKDANSTFC